MSPMRHRALRAEPLQGNAILRPDLQDPKASSVTRCNQLCSRLCSELLPESSWETARLCNLSRSTEGEAERVTRTNGSRVGVVS